MEEPEEFNLLINLVVGIAILVVFMAGGGLDVLLSRPSITKTFPVAVPIKGAILSLLGVFAFALVIGGISFIVRLFSR